MSPLSAAYRETLKTLQIDQSDVPVADRSIPGELSITPELKEAFVSSLRRQAINLRFFSGSWETFDLNQTGGRYDVVLTSETIYRLESLHPLIDLMQAACTGQQRDRPLEELVSGQLSISPTPSVSTPPYICLVAAKVLYFGVGGGVSEFVRLAESRGRVEKVWETAVGVARKVLRIEWGQKP